MKISGIIAEYNPLHNGHLYHIEQTRLAGASHVIVVMSGNFTQRGEPALLPKAERVKMALSAGADLVVELPVPWAVSSAEKFALGGISILHNMGCVDTVSFGSECGNIQLLTAVATCMAKPEYTKELHAALRSGVSFAAAQQTALQTTGTPDLAALLEYPNNTLGIEYCKAILRLQSNISPFTISRKGASHDSHVSDGTTASAKHIRSLIAQSDPKLASEYMSPACFDILQKNLKDGRCVSNLTSFYTVLLSHLRQFTKDKISKLPGVSEGLENRLYTAFRNGTSIPEILEIAKSKRYSLTRLQRILISALLQIPSYPVETLPPYIRVLGIGANGSDLLHQMQDTAKIPLFTDAMQIPSHPFAQEIFDLECKASDLYGSFLPHPDPCGQEFTTGMLHLKNI